MKLLKYIIKRKVFISLLVILIIFLGSYAFLNLDRELTPVVDLNGASIEVDAGDLTVADVESNITTPLEQELQKIDGVNKIESTTYLGGSSIQASFEDGYDKDLGRELETVVQSFKNNSSVIKKVDVSRNGSGTKYGFILDISGGDMSEMSEFASSVLKPRLEQLPEVQDVKFSGIKDYNIDIAFEREKLLEQGVEVTQVVDIIRQVNSESTVGKLSNEDAPSLRWNTKLNNVDDMKNIQIPSQSGNIVLDDIAEVSINAQDNTSNVWKNGKKDFILVQIGGAPEITQIELAEAVRHTLDEIHDDDLVNGFSMNEIVAHGDFVNDSMNSVTKNMVIGGVIAVLVLLLFLRNFHAIVIIGVSIPTSILLTIVSMWLGGYSLNMLTLVGLGLGIGMMVDSSIVVLESIYKKKEQGFSSYEAVVQGTSEVSNAIIASVLTTIAVFLPIGLIGGDTGKFMIIFSVVVAITLISSVIIAFTLIPVLAEKFMKIRKKKEKVKDKGLLGLYHKMLAWIIAKKVRSFLIIVLFLFLFGFSLFLVPKIPMNIMPDVFHRYTEIGVELESGTTDDEKQAIAKSIHKKLKLIKDIKANYVIDQGNVFISVIKMTSGDEIHYNQKEVTDKILRELRSLQESHSIRSVHRALSGSSGYPVQINIRGEDFDKLQTIAIDMVNKTETIDGIVEASHSMEATTNMQEILLREDELENHGITKLEMKSWLEQSLLGDIIGEIDGEYGRKIPMRVSWDDFKGTKESLLNLDVPALSDKKLSAFMELKEVNVPKEIYHINGERSISIFADIDGRDLGAVNRDVQNMVDNYKLDSGYSVSLGGELEEQQELMKDTIFVLVISIFLVYLVMAVQFNHFGQPLIVMSTIPVTIIGVILGMFMTQMELNIMSAMGLIMLVGIVLNNAILLIHRTNQLLIAGHSLHASIINASQDRIRPIFMTTLTTVGGMIPLAMASGMSADYQAPLATVIISGLLFSTLITLVLIPAIYRLFSRA
ncbi:acriflavin resistance protein [Virgibacillus pantothenticus]|uniref:efflux RND transporter permease subunit n=1 Tax=Virgibacillus pantothenticus TaxID=1473 RepID=UPI001B1802A7|nr:efflux RND transporter permease subunit [Virgibacillus pantothenticus]GIP63115.1 acriflavin resistance protein [Virgibacillus pantothenticus]